MAEIDGEFHATRFGLGAGIIRYAAALSLFAMLWFAGDHVILSWWIYPTVYFALGIALARLVQRRLVEWRGVYRTVDNIARGKLGTLLLWPIAYPFLFLKIAIARHL